jgi:hypothetical protein
MLKCRIFGGKTGPFPVGRVFRGVRPIAMIRFRVEPELEPTREFGLIANTISNSAFSKGYIRFSSGSQCQSQFLAWYN